MPLVNEMPNEYYVTPQSATELALHSMGQILMAEEMAIIEQQGGGKHPPRAAKNKGGYS